MKRRITWPVSVGILAVSVLVLLATLFGDEGQKDLVWTLAARMLAALGAAP